MCSAGFLETNPFKIAFEHSLLVARGPFPNDAWCLVAGDLLDMKQVFKGMPLRRHTEFKFLDSAMEPIGELEASDVPFSFTAKETIPGGKIPDEFEGVKDRTFSRSIRPAQNSKGIEWSLEGDKAPEVVNIKPRYHGILLVVVGLRVNIDDDGYFGRHGFNPLNHLTSGGKLFLTLRA